MRCRPSREGIMIRAHLASPALTAPNLAGMPQREVREQAQRGMGWGRSWPLEKPNDVVITVPSGFNIYESLGKAGTMLDCRGGWEKKRPGDLTGTSKHMEAQSEHGSSLRTQCCFGETNVRFHGAGLKNPTGKCQSRSTESSVEEQQDLMQSSIQGLG